LLEFKEDTIQKFRELTNPENIQEYPQLEERLTKRLQTLVPQSIVHLTPGKAVDPTFTLPETKVELTEDGFRGSIDRKGHGLQRSFIISIIQELAVVQAQRDEQTRRTQNGNVEDPSIKVANDFRPDLILTIEEPELFQHPIRQKHFANVLSDLTKKDDISGRARIQVILCTHSPYFVSIQKFDCIRLALKNLNISPSETLIRSADLNSICTKYCSSRGIAVPDVNIFMNNLKNIVSNEIGEAFFASKVILVEGVDDKSVLEAVLLQKGKDLVSAGIPILSANGKCNIGRIKLVLESLGIEVFYLFDCDQNKTRPNDIEKNKEENTSLMIIGGMTATDIIPFPDEPIINSEFACFPVNLERILQGDFAEFDFNSRRSQIASELKVDEKNPNVYKRLIEEAYLSEIVSPTLEQIIIQIVNKFHL
jgi:putative ATP-dependent endonuclease of OLD family